MGSYAPQETAQRSSAGVSTIEKALDEDSAPGSVPRTLNESPRVAQLEQLRQTMNGGKRVQELAQISDRLNKSNGVVQGYFKYGPKTFTTAEQVRDKFKPEDLGSSKIKPKDKARVLAERYQAIQDMADSPDDEGTIGNLTDLKARVANYVNAGKVIASGVPSSLAVSSGSVSVSGMLATGSTASLPPDLKILVDELLASKRAFPAANILKTAKDATGDNGGGYFNELRLAQQFLADETALVQVGVVAPGDLREELGFDPQASEIEAKGFVGGDITVWHQPGGTQPKTTFVQAKTANRSTVKANLIAASNQLAGLTASGDPTGKQAQREFTYTGPAYAGAIYVSMVEAADPDFLNKAARSAISKNSKYVGSVVYQFGDGTSQTVTAASATPSVAASSSTGDDEAPSDEHL